MDLDMTGSREFFRIPLPKKVLVFLESGVVPSLNAIESLKDEWEVVPVRTLESLKKHARKEKTSVGLAYFPVEMTEKKYVPVTVVLVGPPFSHTETLFE